MAIPETVLQEQLSLAYINAITSYAGFGFEGTSASIDFGIDGEVVQSSIYKGVWRSSGTVLNIQLKATHAHRESNQYIHYQLKEETYIKLKAPTAVPQVLVIYTMPKDRNKWLNLDSEKLILSKCAHWVLASSIPTLKRGKKSQIIRIPRTNIFDVKTIKDLTRPVIAKIKKADINA